MPSINNVERFREKLNQAQLCVGTFVGSADPLVSELLGDIGHDFIIVDCEHSPIDTTQALGHLLACRGTGCAPMVRVPWNDQVMIKQTMDFHPAGIVVPLIRTAEDAANAIRAAKYPPQGMRGFGPGRGMSYGAKDIGSYLQEADSQTMIFLQIEHVDAVKNIDAILDTEGLDGLMFGPNDLSGSIGLLGQPAHRDVIKLVDEVAAKVKNTNLFLGVATGYSGNIDTLQAWVDRGVDWLALNSDYTYLQAGASKTVADVRQLQNS